MEDVTQYLTVAEVSAKLGISTYSVRKLIRAKQLRAVKIGQWKVRPEDLEAFIKTRRNY
jgi:excisionase family DNA binding protein